MSDKSDVRYVIEARLLGLDDSNNKKRKTSVSWRHANRVIFWNKSLCSHCATAYITNSVRDCNSWTIPLCFYLRLVFFFLCRAQEKEFAIEVKLSDESHYVIFRTVKEITRFHVSGRGAQYAGIGQTQQSPYAVYILYTAFHI